MPSKEGRIVRDGFAAAIEAVQKNTRRQPQGIPFHALRRIPGYRFFLSGFVQSSNGLGPARALHRTSRSIWQEFHQYFRLPYRGDG